ncbi:MAG TPA: YraN family protein [Terriglobales bacterium]|nr:YraN family protein [Terriglobales bacterium]
MPFRTTRAAIAALDWLAARVGHSAGPAHLQRGRSGEDHAYFYLRKLGYTMVARNYRSPHQNGEIDLIGWDGDVLCFIEVKTRSTRQVAPAEAAVDEAKRRNLQRVAGDYLRRLRQQPAFRFDVVSIYCENKGTRTEVTLFRDAFSGRG